VRVRGTPAALTRPALHGIGPCRQIGAVIGPGVSVYFEALRLLAIVFAALACTCVRTRVRLCDHALF
jgi:hypothetical protein